MVTYTSYRLARKAHGLTASGALRHLRRKLEAETPLWIHSTAGKLLTAAVGLAGTVVYLLT